MRDRYLNLLARTLTGMTYEDPPIDPWHAVLQNSAGEVVKVEDAGSGRYSLHPGKYDPVVRERGGDWPNTAVTMVGLKRLQSLRTQIETIVRDGVPGDLLEAGVWRGGASIFMRAALEGIDTERRVFAADSFTGLPAPSIPEDQGDLHHNFGPLAVSLDEVRENFARYGLLDDRVVFLKGWFKDTLQPAPIDRLALLRLDGDMYESTMDVLTACYDKLSPGGYCVVDDFNLPGVRSAIHAFAVERQIRETPELTLIDGNSIFWRKA